MSANICLLESNAKSLILDTLKDLRSMQRVTNDSNSTKFQSYSISFKSRHFNYINDSMIYSNISQDIIELNLNNKQIWEIQNGCFRSLTCLQHLDLSSNGITFIKQRQFQGLDNLISLNLAHNNIYFVNDFIFKLMGNLRVLNLSYNSIYQINRSAFFMLTKLEWLSVRKNRLKVLGNYYHFRYLTNLKHLDMTLNAFLYITINHFTILESLETWNLSSNNAVKLDDRGPIQPFFNLRVLDLSNNGFNFVFNTDRLKQFFPNNQLTIDINNNLFYCSYLEKILKDFHRYNISYAPGRNLDDSIPNREHIRCDLVNVSDYSERVDNYYGDLVDKIRERLRQNKKIPNKEYYQILKLYKADHVHHKHMMIFLIVANCLLVLYNILITTDYLSKYGYLKTLCVRSEHHIVRQPPQIGLPIELFEL
ncbi:hypothetical protein GWI33_007379 [Rhynchophorus ferrugineus]|uniref:Uncharacterized protein n=1 Tax=Rhynchophorus ferrugineus TaxID=354439 RepID=A0A834ITB5_RHYFE|nr:hypothetical protein GWI33_007379 [Rhynchophorus ferrugineus]